MFSLIVSMILFLIESLDTHMGNEREQKIVVSIFGIWWYLFKVCVWHFCCTTTWIHQTIFDNYSAIWLNESLREIIDNFMFNYHKDKINSAIYKYDESLNQQDDMMIRLCCINFKFYETRVSKNEALYQYLTEKRRYLFLNVSMNVLKSYIVQHKRKSLTNTDTDTDTNANGADNFNHALEFSGANGIKRAIQGM